MKSLQEYEDVRYEVRALALMNGVERAVPNPDQVILLLHGLHERGLRIFRKLVKHLPENALILAPNGPFPLPREKNGRTEYGFAWYFYDRATKSYHLDQKLAVSWLTELLRTKNLPHLPLTIIGFSQGGYLAPLLGHALPETKLVIGLGCEFRDNLVAKDIRFPLVGLHGESDRVVNVNHSRTEAEKQNLRWEMIPATAHEISEAMAVRVRELLEEYGKNRLSR